jgi:signal peptide peptidase SppA
MKILDVLNSPWAIVPDKLAEITEIYGRHLRGEKIDIAAIEAKLGKPLASQPRGYTVAEGGVAVLPVEGVLAKRMNLMMDISGGTSLQYLARDLAKALADASVQSVILAIDSPGGTVDGTLELGRMVMDARAGAKPVVAWVDGNMMSGAYWIGSAADAVYIGANSDQIGSIGVAMQHVDYSGMDAQAGIRRTDIYAGKYKRMGSSAAPLSEEGRAYLQDQVDYIYSLFVDAVATQRGVSSDQVLSDMADGRIFIGRQAIQAGLVDGASTLDALVAELASGRYVRRRMKAAGVAALGAGANAAPVEGADGAGAAPSVETPKPEEDTMDLKELKEKHPELAKALIDEGFAAGSAAERERIQSVEAQVLPGHEDLIKGLKFDGKTTGPQAAVAVLAAEKAKKGKALENLRADAPAPAPAAASETGDPDAGRQGADATAPLEERCKQAWDRDAKLRAEFTNYESFLAFERANAAGQVKVLGKAAR